MKKSDPPKNNTENKKPFSSNDHTGTDNDADHSGSDCDNDETGAEVESKNENRFDKPKREVYPDTTGIDIDADKTKNK